MRPDRPPNPCMLLGRRSPPPTRFTTPTAPYHVRSRLHADVPDHTAAKTGSIAAQETPSSTTTPGLRRIARSALHPARDCHPWPCPVQQPHRAATPPNPVDPDPSHLCHASQSIVSPPDDAHHRVERKEDPHRPGFACQRALAGKGVPV